MEEYAAWMAAELERLGGPVDLVGHDWGGGFGPGGFDPARAISRIDDGTGSSGP